MTNWSSLLPGVLNDTAIKSVHDVIFAKGFQEKSVQQCCYEFHVGDEVIDLSKDETDRASPLQPGEAFLIRPRSTVVVKIDEEIRIPNDCMARFLLKGKFFSVGIAPVNTYADPGFSGHMGLVLTNMSDRYLRIERGEAISKAEFVKLPIAVVQGYEGQHGFRTGFWPILQKYKAKPEHLRKLGINPNSYSEIRMAYGEPVADLVSKVRYYSWVVWVQLAIVVAFMLIVLNYKDNIGPTMSIALGVVSNLFTAILFIALRKHLPESWGRDL